MPSVMERPRTINRIVAFDKSSARTVDAQGFMHVEGCNISKATVNPYYGREIPDWQRLGLDANKVYQVLRPADELAKAAHTFNNLPLLAGHKEVTADELDNDEIKKYIAGSTGTDAHFDGPYLKNSIVVWTQGAINAVDTKEQHELSCAYRYDYIPGAGTFKGKRYDGKMANIVGNHVALVEEGRAGPDVMVADKALQTEVNVGVKNIDEKFVDAVSRAVEDSLVRERRVGGLLADLITADALDAIAKRDDASPKEGEHKYGDVTFADEKNKKYPIDTPEHVRAALSYWGQAGNKEKYEKEDQDTITERIHAAAKKFKIGDYAQDSEREDIASANVILRLLETLLAREEAEKEEEPAGQLEYLHTAIASVKKFIASEKTEAKPATGDSAHLEESRMGKPKPRTISPQGQVVRGALLAYLKPRLASDAAIRPGEIATIVKKVAPGRYATQVDGLVGVVADTFKTRLAEDNGIDLRELNELLTSLEGEFANDEKGERMKSEKAEDGTGMPETEVTDKKPKVCEKCGKAHDEAEDCIAKDSPVSSEEDEPDEEDDDEEGEEGEKKAKDDSEAFDKFAKKHKLSKDAHAELKALTGPKKAPIKGDAMPETKAVTQTAMDAALESQRKSVISEMSERFQAAKDVAPIVGEVDALAADSAASIYKMALDAKKVNLTDAPASAYKAIFKALPATIEVAPTVHVGADAASVQDFTTRYPHASNIKKG